MSDIFKVIRLPLQFWKYLGLFSYTTTTADDNIYISSSKSHSILSGMLQALIFLHVIYIHYHILWDLKSLLSLMERCTFVAFTVLEMIYLLINVALRELLNRRKIKLLNVLNDIVRELDRIDIEFDYHGVRKICTRIFVLSVISICYFIVVLVSGVYILKKPLVIIGGLSGLYIMLIYYSLVGQYTIFLSIIKLILLKLNKRILMFRLKSSVVVNDIESLRIISRTYERVFECVERINALYALPILFRFSVMFAFAVLQIFNAASAINLKVPSQINLMGWLFVVVSLLSNIVLCAIEVGSYILASELYKKEVRLRT